MVSSRSFADGAVEHFGEMLSEIVHPAAGLEGAHAE